MTSRAVPQCKSASIFTGELTLPIDTELVGGALTIDGAATVCTVHATAVAEAVDVRVQAVAGLAVWERSSTLVIGRTLVGSSSTNAGARLEQTHAAQTLWALVISYATALGDADALGIATDGSRQGPACATDEPVADWPAHSRWSW